jgi:hypothetical protein
VVHFEVKNFEVVGALIQLGDACASVSVLTELPGANLDSGELGGQDNPGDQ